MKKLFIIFSIILLSCQNNIVHERDEQNNTVQESKIVEIDEVIIISDNRNELLKPLFNTMRLEQAEKLPFDEPLKENGRQFDGRLRPMWEAAYKAHKKKYHFETTIYRVFGANKAPLVPQVCADFIVDTIDRTAGTWYSNYKLVSGKINLRKDIENNKFNPRDVNDLMDYMRSKPDNYQFIFDGDGPVVGNAPKLKEWLEKIDAQPGDMVFIKGRTPWDRGKTIHHHSFFITKMDKEVMIFGNAAFPAEWTLEREVKRAPKRHVIAVIRLTNKFLTQIN
jgi:hypothetical protein